MRLARGSAPWVLVPLVLAVALALYDPPLALPALVVTVLVAAFFRDPERDVADGIVAAADGRVQGIDIRDDGTRAVVTFLNVHNVHVIRAPYTGTVAELRRLPGGHLPAFSKGAKRNAGLKLTLDTAWGVLGVDLIAGLVARRALSYVVPGERVERGQRIGIIQFGSRVDVELPAGAKPVVGPGQRVRAASSTLAEPPGPTVSPDPAGPRPAETTPTPGTAQPRQEVDAP